MDGPTAASAAGSLRALRVNNGYNKPRAAPADSPARTAAREYAAEAAAGALEFSLPSAGATDFDLSWRYAPPRRAGAGGARLARLRQAQSAEGAPAASAAAADVTEPDAGTAHVPLAAADAAVSGAAAAAPAGTGAASPSSGARVLARGTPVDAGAPRARSPGQRCRDPLGAAGRKEKLVARLLANGKAFEERLHLETGPSREDGARLAQSALSGIDAAVAAASAVAAGARIVASVADDVASRARAGGPVAWRLETEHVVQGCAGSRLTTLPVAALITTTSAPGVSAWPVDAIRAPTSSVVAAAASTLSPVATASPVGSLSSPTSSPVAALSPVASRRSPTSSK